MYRHNNAIGTRILSKQWQHSPSHYRHGHSSASQAEVLPPSASNKTKSCVDNGRPSSALPIPPIFDQDLIERKRRINFKRPKPLQKATDRTDFQKRLASNPYANILATPVRQCFLTGARTPQHFILPLFAQFRPKTLANGTDKLVPRIVLQIDKNNAGPKSGMIALRSLVRAIGRKKAWHRIISKAMLDRYKFKDKKDWAPPDALEHAALEHLRHAAFTKLKWAFDMPNAKLVRPFEEANTDLADASCILLLQSRVSGVDLNLKDSEVFNLPSLLGEPLAKSLIESTEYARTHAVILPISYLTTAMHLALLKLRMYVEVDESEQPL